MGEHETVASNVAHRCLSWLKDPAKMAEFKKVCVCVCACVRACVCACVCVCVCVCVSVCLHAAQEWRNHTSICIQKSAQRKSCFRCLVMEMVHNDLYSLGKLKVFTTCWADLSRKVCDKRICGQCEDVVCVCVL